MKKWLLLGLACLCLFAVAAKAEEKATSPSLFGVSLGMTYSEACESIASLPIGKPRADGTSNGYFYRDINGILFNMRFDSNAPDYKVFAVSADFPSESFETVSQALKTKYGEGRTKKSIIKTGIGVEYEQVEIFWLFSDGSLFIQRFSGKVINSFVGMMSKEGEREIEKGKAKQSDDLIKKGF